MYVQGCIMDCKWWNGVFADQCDAKQGETRYGHEAASITRSVACLWSLFI